MTSRVNDISMSSLLSSIGFLFLMVFKSVFAFGDSGFSIICGESTNKSEIYPRISASFSYDLYAGCVCITVLSISSGVLLEDCLEDCFSDSACAGLAFSLAAFDTASKYFLIIENSLSTDLPKSVEPLLI